MLNTDRFEEFISQYPIYEYRLVDTAEIEVRERVRIICKQECERYGTTGCDWKSCVANGQSGS